MTPPTVTETIRPLQPVEHDPFIDDDPAPTPPPPNPGRRRIFD